MRCVLALAFAMLAQAGCYASHEGCPRERGRLCCEGRPPGPPDRCACTPLGWACEDRDAG